MPSTVWSSIVSRLGGNKRAAEEEEDARPAKSRKTKEPSKASYAVTPRQLVMLGGFWEGVPPFNGDEDRLYRWLAEPALWARLVMNDLEPRVQQRIVQLHAGIHDGLDASGFVCWRTLPPLQPGVRVSLRAYGLKGTSVDLPRVTIKQLQFLPSSRFGEGWEARSFAGPPASAAATPPWLRNARRLVQRHGRGGVVAFRESGFGHRLDASIAGFGIEVGQLDLRQGVPEGRVGAGGRRRHGGTGLVQVARLQQRGHVVWLVRA